MKSQIDWVRCIHSDGWHNAFTDLQLFQGKYYVCFRNGLSHVSTEGKVVVIASDDLYQWQRIGVPINTTGDDRDPHMVATPHRLSLLQELLLGTTPWLCVVRQRVTSAPTARTLTTGSHGRRLSRSIAKDTGYGAWAMSTAPSTIWLTAIKGF